MPQDVRTYIAIDLKSFYASVECVERGLDPLTTNLVVADRSRTNKTICLAVSPSLKAYGIGGRARLFEVERRLKAVNLERSRKARGLLTGKSVYDDELKEHPDWEVDFIAAPPRMSYYINVSTRIYQIYLKYVAAEDVHVYSIDEVFMDVTQYLETYHMTAHELAIQMIRDVLSTTGITATAGIGTNMYLAKVAMDIVAKHTPADKNGVRIAELDEISYRRRLWGHRPLTSFWRVGRGTAERLERYGITTMGQIARLSLQSADLFYKLFGVNAEVLIDHAWGWEPCTIAQVKAYRPEHASFSCGQVLKEPYPFEKARVVLSEMADSMSLKLFSKRMATNQLVLTVSYDAVNISDPALRKKYDGPVTTDYYGRPAPKHANGTENLEQYTSSAATIIPATLRLFDRITHSELLIRRLSLSTNNVILESQIQSSVVASPQLNLFTDYEAVAQQRQHAQEVRARERRLQKAQLDIKTRFGKNALLRGISFTEGATARERNEQIGGHKA